MARMLEALECPVVNESKITKDRHEMHYPGIMRCRACRHEINVYDVPRRR